MKVMVIKVSAGEYLNKNESYLKNKIINLQNSYTWKT